jgi:hypothetical protein
VKLVEVPADGLTALSCAAQSDKTTGEAQAPVDSPAPPEGTAGSPGAGGPALSDSDFSAAVTAVTSAFGDPTRRRIYLYVREHT